MSYEVFARKYRPKTFSEVIGQEAVVKTLSNALKTGRIGQAYLFCGMRGTGKTTIARILAKALNCVRDGNSAPRPDPCGGDDPSCDMCREIDEGRAIDIQEIDGASNRGIEEIRALRESVRYQPLRARYKVVIIDEVHQISGPAFNALLKTIEEPPDRTVFIFATTEFQKVPATIVSRCQHFEFKKLGRKDIIRQLEMISVREGLKITPAGLGMLADSSDGSMRDAQSLLDQAVSLSGNDIQEEDLKVLLRTMSRETLLKFADAAIEGDPSAVFGLVEGISESGYDLKYFFSRLIEHFRALLVVKTVQDAGSFLFMTSDELEALKAQAAKVTDEDLLRYVTALQQAEPGLRYSSMPRIYLEMLLVRLCQFRKILPLKDIIASLDKYGAGCDSSAENGTAAAPRPRTRSIQSGTDTAALRHHTVNNAGPARSEREPRPSYGPAAHHDAGDVGGTRPVPAASHSAAEDKKDIPPAGEHKAARPSSGVFDVIIEKISHDMAALGALLKEYSSVRVKDDQLDVFFPTGKGFLVGTLQPDNIRSIEKIAAEVLGRKVKVMFSEENAPNGEPMKPARIVEAAMKDPSVKYFMDSFKAQVVSVDPIRSSQEVPGPIKPDGNDKENS